LTPLLKINLLKLLMSS